MDKKNKITIRDIAKACGVGVSTVSKVLNNRDNVADSTAIKVRRVVREMGFVPSASARSLRAGAADTSSAARLIEILTNEWDYSSLFHVELMRVLIEEAAGRGYRAMVGVGGSGASRPATAGRILIRSWGETNPKNIPEVTVDYLSADPAVPGILSDYETGIYHAVSTALKRGYQRPMLLSVYPNDDQPDYTSMIYAGFSRALKDAGLSCGAKGDDDEAMVYGQSVTSSEAGYNAALDIFDSPNPPDLLAANDAAAVGIYKAAASRNVRIPEDLGVIGCDNIELVRYLTPGLATVDVGFQRIAVEVFDRLIALINKTSGPYPQKLIADTEFVDNESIRRT